MGLKMPFGMWQGIVGDVLKDSIRKRFVALEIPWREFPYLPLMRTLLGNVDLCTRK